MLLPTNGPGVDFQSDLYNGVVEKTKLLSAKCLGKTAGNSKTDSSGRRNRFRFCVCTGPRKNKNTTKWYVKVRGFFVYRSRILPIPSWLHR